VPKNLLPALAPTGLDHYELLLALNQHYNSVCFDGGRLIYPCNTNYAIKVWWRDGRATQIHSGPGFSAQDFESLKRRIQTDFIQSPGIAIGKDVLFSSPHTVWGYLLTDNLQILPPPPDAPDESGADHPFVLEFVIPRSVNEAITLRRRSRLVFEWTWILNSLLRTNIKCEEARVRQMWASCRHEERPTPTHSHFTNAAYIYGGFAGLAGEFSNPTMPVLHHISHDEYYDFKRWNTGDALILPDSLPRMLRIIDCLTHAERRRFLRAARWVSVARHFLWDAHLSSFYIAVVAGIEALMNAESPSRCENCHQITNATRRFKTFVERYSGEGSNDARLYDHLYAIRSDLAHGEYLFDVDEIPWWRDMWSPNQLDQEEASRLSWIAKRVLVGWVLSHTDPLAGDSLD
jgi:hypothetical protein